jgi:hypothetical protein
MTLAPPPPTAEQIKAQAWADALGSVPSFNADIVFIKAVLPVLIQQRQPKSGDKAILDGIAADSVYLVNSIMTKMAAQFAIPPATT